MSQNTASSGDDETQPLVEAAIIQEQENSATVQPTDDKPENANNADEPNADAQAEQQMDSAIQQDIVDQVQAAVVDPSSVNMAFESDEPAPTAEPIDDDEEHPAEAAGGAEEDDGGGPYPVDGDDQEQNFINQLANIIQARGNNLRRYLNNIFLDRLNRNNYDNLDADEEEDRHGEEDDEEVDEEEEEEDGVEDDENEDEEEEEDVVQEVEDYEQIQKPEAINYDTALPSSHDYLGQNFQTITSPKVVHEINDEVTIPILTLPGNDDFHPTSNSVQLLPGQIMPLYFYAPLQVQMLKKRLREEDPSVGFTLSAKYLRKLLRTQNNQENRSTQSAEQQQQPGANSEDTAASIEENMNIGILAEIISSRDEDSEMNQGPIDQSSMMPGASGLILKVRGRERFEILSARRDITGNVMARVRILPEYIFDRNPLSAQSPRCASIIYDSYLRKLNSSSETLPPQQPSSFGRGSKTLDTKAEIYNMALPHPAWIYRKFDCFYTIDLILKELNDTFQQLPPLASSVLDSNVPPSTSSAQLANEEEDDDMETAKESSKSNQLSCFTEPLLFSNWLLNNFPFDNTMRFKCLKLNCVNQRLMYMHSLLKSFSVITCRACGTQLCSKSDVFSMSKQGFMQAYLNPGGFVHETLTVYKAKNLRLMNSRPTTANSWFPGYGWIICSCAHCYAHIGWRFSTTNASLKPEKFWGLTRKAVEYTYNREDDEAVPQPQPSVPSQQPEAAVEQSS